jgi:hypothetical protein
MSACIIAADVFSRELVFRLAFSSEGKKSMLAQITGPPYQCCHALISLITTKLFDGFVHCCACITPIMAKLHDNVVQYIRFVVYLVLLFLGSFVCLGFIDKVLLWLRLGSAWGGETWKTPAVISACIIMADVFAQLLIFRLISLLDFGAWKKTIGSAKERDAGFLNERDAVKSLDKALIVSSQNVHAIEIRSEEVKETQVSLQDPQVDKKWPHKKSDEKRESYETPTKGMQMQRDDLNIQQRILKENQIRNSFGGDLLDGLDDFVGKVPPVVLYTLGDFIGIRYWI